MTTLCDTGLTRDQIARETAKAYLFLMPLNGGGELYSRTRELWLPKAQVTWMQASRVYAETAHIPAWLSRKI